MGVLPTPQEVTDQVDEVLRSAAVLGADNLELATEKFFSYIYYDCKNNCKQLIYGYTSSTLALYLSLVNSVRLI